jgi:hypothetical protein
MNPRSLRTAALQYPRLREKEGCIITACNGTLNSTNRAIHVNPATGRPSAVKMACLIQGLPLKPLCRYHKIASILLSGYFIVWKTIRRIRQYSTLYIKESTVFVNQSQYVCEHARISPRNNQGSVAYEILWFDSVSQSARRPLTTARRTQILIQPLCLTTAIVAQALSLNRHTLLHHLRGSMCHEQGLAHVSDSTRWWRTKTNIAMYSKT